MMSTSSSVTGLFRVGRGWLRAPFYALDIAGWPDQLFHGAVMLLPSPLVGNESVPGQSTLWF